MPADGVSSGPSLRSGGRLRRARFFARCLIALPVPFALFNCEDDPPPVERFTKVPSERSQGCGKAGAVKGALAKQPITVNGNARTYDIVIGDAHDGTTPLPLVFVFHDTPRGDGAAIRQAFDIEGEAQGKAIFVYPDAFGDWDVERDRVKNIDILMFDGVVDAVTASHCVDKKRIFATGLGTGGTFSNQLGCRRGSVVLAVASHGGSGPTGDDVTASGGVLCPERPVAALITHGSDDGTIKLELGQSSRDHWRRVNGCRPGPGDPRDPAPCIELLGCAEHRTVRYCEVPGIGHTLWPAGGAKATWSFFMSL
jgi:polyhydroxybutyrate depolymerase